MCFTRREEKACAGSKSEATSPKSSQNNPKRRKITLNLPIKKRI